MSGLVAFISAENFVGKLVIVATNLKPQKFAGVLSNGMVLAASNSDKSKVEILQAPEDCKIGELITFDGYECNHDLVLNPKQKVFEKCAVDFCISSESVAMYKDVAFMTSQGAVTVQSLTAGVIG